MTPDRLGALHALLVQTEQAHGDYESTTLQGVYDAAWPRWYAEYAVQHGIGDQAGRDLTAEQLAAFFERTWAEYQQRDPKPADPWSAYTAQRIADEL